MENSNDDNDDEDEIWKGGTMITMDERISSWLRPVLGSKELVDIEGVRKYKEDGLLVVSSIYLFMSQVMFKSNYFSLRLCYD